MTNRVQLDVSQYVLTIYDSDVAGIVGCEVFSDKNSCQRELIDILMSFEPLEEDEPEVFKEYENMNYGDIVKDAFKDSCDFGYWLPGKHRLISINKVNSTIIGDLK